MPVLYRAKNHPLVKGVAGVRNVYVGYMQTDLGSMRNTYNFERRLTCPEGGTLEWEKKGKCSIFHLDHVFHTSNGFPGLLKGVAGDYVFLRDPKVSRDPSDDVLAVMITGR